MTGTATTLAAVTLLGLAAAALLPVPRRKTRAATRLRRTTPHQGSRTAGSRAVPKPMVLAAPVTGIGVALLVPGWAGLCCGLVAACGVAWLVRRIEPPDVRRMRARAVADLPFALDLLAAALTAGVPIAAAATAVGDALGGPLGERLTQAGRSLALGGAAGAAWHVVRDVPGGERLADAAVRGADSGAGLARALARVSADLRATQRHAQEAASQRAGVLVVLPLGLCFLPAFVVGGLVPVVASTLGAVLP